MGTRCPLRGGTRCNWCFTSKGLEKKTHRCWIGARKASVSTAAALLDAFSLSVTLSKHSLSIPSLAGAGAPQGQTLLYQPRLSAEHLCRPRSNICIIFRQVLSASSQGLLLQQLPRFLTQCATFSSSTNRLAIPFLLGVLERPQDKEAASIAAFEPRLVNCIMFWQVLQRPQDKDAASFAAFEQRSVNCIMSCQVLEPPQDKLCGELGALKHGTFQFDGVNTVHLPVPRMNRSTSVCQVLERPQDKHYYFNSCRTPWRLSLYYSCAFFLPPCPGRVRTALPAPVTSQS